VSQKVPTFKLLVTLSNINRFLKFCTAESVQNLLQNPYDTTHFTLGMLLHYLGKSKIQIFCKYLADMEKMQTNCILSAPILIPLHV